MVTSDEITYVSALMTWSGLSIDQCLLTKWGGGCGVGWLPIWGYYPTMSTHGKLLISISTVGRWKLSLAEIDRVATTIKKMRLQKIVTVKMALGGDFQERNGISIWHSGQ